MASFYFQQAFLPPGWVDAVRVTTGDGRIVSVETGVHPEPSDICEGIAIPGLANVHSHAFQRAMAGLGERRSGGQDSFWTWREVMYRFLAAMGPDDVEAIAEYAYCDMLEAGFTSVGEFHYLHRAPDGSLYDPPAELAFRHIAAAARTGIAITMLPVYYAHSGFGEQPPVAGQRRFLTDPDLYVRLFEAIGAAQGAAPTGVAPHSLRAVGPAALVDLIALAGDRPFHIHAAEQRQEVEDCVAWSGRRPVQWLFDNHDVRPNWCFIHATHLVDDEIQSLARSGAIAGLCPITEANLGDGVFPAVDYRAQGGLFGVGTDSNIMLDAAGELRQLEYSQRLLHEQRNLLVLPELASTGASLFTAALGGGAQALGNGPSGIQQGARADFVILNEERADPILDQTEALLDGWIFSTGRRAIGRVYAAGKMVVDGGRHLERFAIADRYRRTLAKLLN